MTREAEMAEQESQPIQETHGAARRVAINALSPFAAQIVTKVLMLGYVIVQYRLVGGGPNGPLGDYFLAGIVFLLTSTVADWGLSTLLTREVAKDRGIPRGDALVAAMFRQTLSLRILISLALFVPALLYIAVYVTFFRLSAEGAWATALLTVSLLPSALSGSVTALLNAYERMSLPAGIGVVTSLVNVSLGITALLLGWGVVGLAGTAALTTLLTAALFWRILRRDFPTIHVGVKGLTLRPDRDAIAKLLKAGWPLMLNALLVSLFFRADQFVIKPNRGGLAVEQYEAAYRFLNFVLLITPAVTLALFPRMSRHAATDRGRLAYEYTFALKVLLLISAPIVALTVWFAPLLIAVVTANKADYVPESILSLQILIFFLPFSFINGVTQYVLIALDRQRLITKAFGMTVVFNIGANLALVPLIGIYGAGIATVLSELVLLGPFLVWTGREIGPVPIVALVARPVLGGAIMAVLAYLLWPLARNWSAMWLDFSIYIAAGLLFLGAYAVVLRMSRPFSAMEMSALRGALRRQ